ncbi:DUF6292 family protein [Streptomyces sp. DSM 41634]|uniref:DUF6292 family protein n=1 Tax=Streptomyces sp. DSM 41634 TaxID=3448656 RepID=UPI00403FEA16
MSSETSPKLAVELSRHAGHYAAAVAEVLLKEGLPVSGISSCGPYDDPEEPYSDVQASIDFTKSFQDQYGGDCGLHWAGSSGWCFYRVTDEAQYLKGARWLGAGLVPEPRRVASFVDTIRLDPDVAGSVEQPYYRQDGQGFPELMARLRPYVPVRHAYSPSGRVDSARKDAYSERVVAALNHPASTAPVRVPLRQGELVALLHLLEYSETHQNPFGRLLAADIRARIGDRAGGAELHESALEEAVRRQRARDQRRGQVGAI